MFGLGKPTCRMCHRRRDRCICHACNCGSTPAAGVTQPAPAPMRIEFLTPLIVVQPVEQPNFVNNINEVVPAPKDAPVDDYQWNTMDEMDNSWMETPYEIEGCDE